MVGEQKLKQIAEKVLSLTTADQAEVILSTSESMLTRFANSQIHQNMSWENIWVSVRVVFGKKIGTASDNCYDEESLHKLMKKAETLAKLQKEDPHFVSLPKPEIIKNIATESQLIKEKDITEAVNSIIKVADDGKVTASGAYQGSIGEVGIANTLGVWAYHESNSVDLSTIFIGKESTGFAAEVGKTPHEVNALSVAHTALNKVNLGANPIDMEPGEYEVILEPQAVSEMMAFLSIYAPNAKLYHEQSSFYSGKLREKVFGENITIIDDPLNEEYFPMPFDFEGYPKEKLTLIEKGVLTNIVYDSYTAHLYKAKNTGHALPAPNAFGPVPTHVTLMPGDKSKAELIKSVKKGLLVTRLWYVRVLNVLTLEITGMTRDGTFLIENGDIKGGVKNLRFNQSIPEALNNVIAIEDTCTPLSSFEGELGISLLPALHIKKWNFSSATVF